MLAARSIGCHRTPAPKSILEDRAKHLCRLLGEDKLVSALKSGDLELYRRARAAEGVANRTINLEVHHVLAPALKRAIADKMIADPGLELRRLPEHRARPRVLSVEEVAALLGGVEQSTIRNKADAREYIAFLVLTGLRRGEMMGSPDGVDQGADWTAVDWRAKALLVRNAKRGGRGHTTERRVPLSAEAMEILRRRRERAGNPSEGAIFPWKMRLREWLPAAAKAANLPRPDAISPHTLRHTFATLALQSGASIRDVAALIGDSVETTARRYLHESEEMMRRAVGALGAAVTSASQEKSNKPAKPADS